MISSVVDFRVMKNSDTGGGLYLRLTPTSGPFKGTGGVPTSRCGSILFSLSLFFFCLFFKIVECEDSAVLSSVMTTTVRAAVVFYLCNQRLSK